MQGRCVTVGKVHPQTACGHSAEAECACATAAEEQAVIAAIGVGAGDGEEESGGVISGGVTMHAIRAELKVRAAGAGEGHIAVHGREGQRAHTVVGAWRSRSQQAGEDDAVGSRRRDRACASKGRSRAGGNAARARSAVDKDRARRDEGRSGVSVGKVESQRAGTCLGQALANA